MSAVVNFIRDVIIATITQMLILFGPLLAVGFLIAFFEKMSNKMLMKVFSFKAVIYSTGWLGTPIHETGHAIFCLLFGHKIHEFVPFKPERDESGGYVLGYVKHSCKGSIYNNIGYLFIGTGPIILGSIIIALLIRFLLPGGSGFFTGLNTEHVPEPERLLRNADRHCRADLENYILEERLEHLFHLAVLGVLRGGLLYLAAYVTVATRPEERMERRRCLRLDTPHRQHCSRCCETDGIHEPRIRLSHVRRGNIVRGGYTVLHYYGIDIHLHRCNRKDQGKMMPGRTH